MKNNTDFAPSHYQSPYPLNQFISKGMPEGENLEMDVLFVGAGPASLAGAIRLSQLYKGQKQIAIIEKASRLGGHSLSGAVINPIAFQKLFPSMDIKDSPLRFPVQSEKMYFLTKKNHYRIPAPPTMKNKRFYTASLCEVVRWLGQKAETAGIHIFPNTPGHKLIVEKDKVIGVQTTASGLNRNSEKTSQYQAPINILAKNIFLAEGVRGNLSQAWLKWKNISSFYPQNYALGIKEIWKVKHPPKEIFHTVGWPLEGFGGSFLYPLSQEHIALGLVGSMGSKNAHWNLNEKFQLMKDHPFFQKILQGGECLEWGAKAIPEGGFYSIPQKISDDSVFLLGDAIGLVNVPALKGVHYAMLSGILSAEYLFSKTKNTASFSMLSPTDTTNQTFEDVLKNHPLIGKPLYRVRNIMAFLQTGRFGWIKAGLSILSCGVFPRSLNPKKLLSDSEKLRSVSSLTKDSKKQKKSSLHLSKTDAVYLSGNKTRDDIPSHLTAPSDLPSEVTDFYTHFCPAGVYEKKDGKLIVNAPNCVDCKATDVLGPWWSPREGGSGPDYNLM